MPNSERTEIAKSPHYAKRNSHNTAISNSRRQFKPLRLSGTTAVGTEGGSHSGGRKGKKRGPKAKASKGAYKEIDKPTLVTLLKKAEGKTVARKQLNAAGYSLNSAIEIAKDDKATFSFQKNGAQGSVSLK